MSTNGDDGMALVANVMGAMLNDAHSTGQTLIEMQDADITKLRAELNLVRDNMDYLLGQPWQPSTRSLERALYPSREAVDRAVKQGMGDFYYRRG